MGRCGSFHLPSPNRPANHVCRLTPTASVEFECVIRPFDFHLICERGSSTSSKGTHILTTQKRKDEEIIMSELDTQSPSLGVIDEVDAVGLKVTLLKAAMELDCAYRMMRKSRRGDSDWGYIPLDAC